MTVVFDCQKLDIHRPHNFSSDVERNHPLLPDPCRRWKSEPGERDRYVALGRDRDIPLAGAGSRSSCHRAGWRIRRAEQGGGAFPGGAWAGDEDGGGRGVPPRLRRVHPNLDAVDARHGAGASDIVRCNLDRSRVRSINTSQDPNVSLSAVVGEEVWVA